MKKYNLSKIMKRAWELVKKSAMTISSGLKKAWEEAKTMVNYALEVFDNQKGYKSLGKSSRKCLIQFTPMAIRVTDGIRNGTVMTG